MPRLGHRRGALVQPLRGDLGWDGNRQNRTPPEGDINGSMPRIDDPCGRAEILLGAMSKMDGTDSHVHNWPAAVIRDLMADIMQYCARRNEGLQPSGRR